MADAPQEVDDMERLADKQAHEDVELEHQQDDKKHDIEDDENETCGFCKFMKGGDCRQAFIDWSKCVDGERDKGNEGYAESCKDATLALRECMLAHRDYYGPLLEEEEEMLREEEEKAKWEAEQAAKEQRGGEAAAAAVAEGK